MTNEQLCLLLQGMIDELTFALSAAHDAMPVDAEQVTRRIPKKSAPLVFGNPDDYHDVSTGDYVALVPFDELRDRWQERVDKLVK